MTRLLHYSIILLAAALVQGCGTMYLEAPKDASIKLLPKHVPTQVRVEKKVWFKWWGAQPWDDPHTSAIIKKHNLKEVRLYMTNTFMDGLCNIFPGMIGFPRRTLIVEGNR